MSGDELEPLIDEHWKNPEFREAFVRRVIRDWFDVWLGDSEHNAMLALKLERYLESRGLTITRTTTPEDTT